MDRVLISCRAGCQTKDVLSALKLTYADLHGRPGGLSMNPNNQPRNYPLWSKVYPFFGAELGLSDQHRLDLRGRGLTDAHIHAHGYRTLGGDMVTVIAETIKDVGEAAVLDTPGFERGDDGKVTTTVKEGLLIPITTVAGQIRAFKVRLDEHRRQGGKYVWFSGGRGGSCGAPAHVPLTAVEELLAGSVIRVVEGPLKANVVTALSRVATIGIPGAGLWKAALPVLLAPNRPVPDAVVLSFDQDWKTNSGVRAARRDLSLELQRAGVPVYFEDWDERFKGVDDALLAGTVVIRTKATQD